MTALRFVVVMIGLALVGQVRAQDAEPTPAGTPAPEPEPAPPAASDAPPAAATPPPATPEAPEPAAQPTGPAAPEVMGADELAALGLDSTTPSIDTSVRLGGFMDAGFSTIFAPEDSYWRATGVVPARPTFLVGNVNLYLNKDIVEVLRTALEVRFTYLPNGSSVFGTSDPISTAANDYTRLGSEVRWAAIIFQRAYLEWDFLPFLSVRVGQFLSPYGVWNVDHGSPVLIPVRQPWSIAGGWIPERQTGLEFLGRTELSGDMTLGYHLTLSNGTGPISEYRDLDNNKAIGGRVFLEMRQLGRLQFGASGYYGRDTNAQYEVKFEGDLASTGSTESIISQYDSLTWAADLTWEIGDFRFQTEWLVNQRKFTEDGRVFSEFTAGQFIPADAVSWGGYGLIGYRLPWLGIMPFVLAERAETARQFIKIEPYSFQFGLNVRPHEDVVLKASFEYMGFGRGLQSVNVLNTQVAWAF
ncbi:MAG TPA: hypothetical protein VJV78_00825 [Polyangiales bacterium]|nr:hypothetical protein [Polyangiales bacterium]